MGTKQTLNTKHVAAHLHIWIASIPWTCPMCPVECPVCRMNILLNLRRFTHRSGQDVPDVPGALKSSPGTSRYNDQQIL